jgi:hypothetical protein
MKKPIQHTQSTTSHAIAALSAYHRASAKSNALWQVYDCATMPDDDARKDILVHILLRAYSETVVSCALAGSTYDAELRAVMSHLSSVISSFFGTEYADIIRIAANSYMSVDAK